MYVQYTASCILRPLIQWDLSAGASSVDELGDQVFLRFLSLLGVYDEAEGKKQPYLIGGP